MFDIGLFEILLVFLIALLVLGPNRLPQAARSVGHMVGSVRRVVSGFQAELEREAHLSEFKEQIKEPMTAFEQSMQTLETDQSLPHNAQDPAQPSSKKAHHG